MVRTDIPTRALIIGFKASGQTTKEVTSLLGILVREVNRIYARAKERGFDPACRPLLIRIEYLTDAPRSGRPSKQTDETKDQISQKVRRDRYGREKTAASIAGELSQDGLTISPSTVLKVLRKLGFRKTKPTRKPGLTKKMKMDRLRWCLERKDWILDDWKNVIWSDETSVVLNYRRGGYRVWR